MFVQFIGIGDESFNYLRSLDHMEGRKHDNTGFTAVKDMNKMTDEQLYTEILRQYKDWLNKKILYCRSIFLCHTDFLFFLILIVAIILISFNLLYLYIIYYLQYRIFLLV